MVTPNVLLCEIWFPQCVKSDPWRAPGVSLRKCRNFQEIHGIQQASNETQKEIQGLPRQPIKVIQKSTKLHRFSPVAHQDYSFLVRTRSASGATGYGLGMDFLMMKSRLASSILILTMNEHPAKAVKHGGPDERIYVPLLIIWQHIKYCIGCTTPPTNANTLQNQ